MREFLLWHLAFWCREAPRRPDGSWPAMQERESRDAAASPLEALLAREDEAAHAWLAARLLARAPVEAGQVLEPGGGTAGARDLEAAEG